MGNNFQGNLKWYLHIFIQENAFENVVWHIFIQENAFENVVCEMASILSRASMC